MADRGRIEVIDFSCSYRYQPDATPLERASESIETVLPEQVYLGLLLADVDVSREQRDRTVNAKAMVRIGARWTNYRIDPGGDPKERVSPSHALSSITPRFD